MRKIFIPFLGLLLLSNSVMAAIWKQYDKKGYLDETSIVREGSTVSVWFKDLNPADWKFRK